MSTAIHAVRAFKARSVELSTGDFLIPELREVSGRLVVDCRLWFYPGKDRSQPRRPSRLSLPLPPQDVAGVAELLCDIARQLRKEEEEAENKRCWSAALAAEAAEVRTEEEEAKYNRRNAFAEALRLAGQERGLQP